MLQTSLVRIGRNSAHSPAQRTFDSTTDRTMQEAMRNIALSKQKFAALDNWIRQVLNLPRSRTRSFLARSLNFLVPARAYDYLPGFMMKMVAEEFDALEAAEGRYRTIINDMQTGIKTLVKVTNEKGQQLEDLKTDIERAEQEGWNARQLHEYILSNAGIEVDPEISGLLDNRFDILTTEEQSTRRQMLLEKLRSNVVIGRSTVDLAVRSCMACLEVFESLGVEFYNYVHAYRPAAALRNAAITVIEGGVVMHGSRAALTATYKTALEAIDSALEANRKCRHFSIVSVDMKKLLETGSARIDAKLKLIAAENRKGLAEVMSLPSAVIDSE